MVKSKLLSISLIVMILIVNQVRESNCYSLSPWSTIESELQLTGGSPAFENETDDVNPSSSSEESGEHEDIDDKHDDNCDDDHHNHEDKSKK